RAGQLGIFCDLFNTTNVAIPTSVFTTSSSYTTINNHVVQFGEPTALTDPRIFRLGVRYSF
ncbi:MAG: hypothetical protein RBR88_01370, partial [Candidatus Saccharicenans sp.]|nr:hypothetical protein [Candidatus Saccharicenans sp.]